MQNKAHISKKVFIIPVFFAALFFLQNCGTSPSEPTLDSGSHWLTSCSQDADCNGMTCACGICTPTCNQTYACNGLTNAACALPASIGVLSLCGDQIPEAICLPTCNVSSDCADPNLACVAGFCEPAELAPCAEEPVTQPPLCIEQAPSTLCVRDQNEQWHSTWKYCEDPREACHSDLDCQNGSSCNAGDVCLQDFSCGGNLCAQCLGWCVVETGISCETDDVCNVGDLCIDQHCEEAICLSQEDPVCGIDGITYTNSCTARAAHIEIAYETACGERVCSEELCGDIPTIADCPDGSHREFACQADPSGECRWHIGDCNSVFCPEQFDPVCGTNNITYQNECFLAAAGVELNHVGECICDPEMCGPEPSVAPCEDGNGPNVSCESSSNGTCEWKIDSCTQQECQNDETCPLGEVCEESFCRTLICPNLWDPVCGNDEITYANECIARVSHVEIIAETMCESRCFSNRDCEPAEACIEGICEIPCSINCLIEDPVCGIDGQTYLCGEPEANCHGVEVAYQGVCEP